MGESCLPFLFRELPMSKHTLTPFEVDLVLFHSLNPSLKFILLPLSVDSSTDECTSGLLRTRRGKLGLLSMYLHPPISSVTTDRRV